jgi:hypothetical protein
MNVTKQKFYPRDPCLLAQRDICYSILLDGCTDLTKWRAAYTTAILLAHWDTEICRGKCYTICGRNLICDQSMRRGLA